ncbi:MAG: sorbitol dehydrogenase family protein [Cyanobacteria bacterium]|nr:sorbitol dehydrogenase family protein [Cyanobacteriota bacterium]
MASLTRRALLGGAVLLASSARLRAMAPVSLAEFIELSQRLLGRSKLDTEVAHLYLTALLADADSAVTLAYLVQSNGNPTAEQAALSRTIIEWWYTGVYEVDGKPRLATHSGALMWNAMRMPAPGTCAAPFGAWSQPPQDRV